MTTHAFLRLFPGKSLREIIEGGGTYRGGRPCQAHCSHAGALGAPSLLTLPEYLLHTKERAMDLGPGPSPGSLESSELQSPLSEVEMTHSHPRRASSSVMTFGSVWESSWAN